MLNSKIVKVCFYNTEQLIRSFDLQILENNPASWNLVKIKVNISNIDEIPVRNFNFSSVGSIVELLLI
jgi:hypothetical protein